MGNHTDENITIFVDESLEHLADIENELLAIEQGGADIDDNLVNKVYRAAHSIKGGAGFMGFATIKDLTHEMENILGKIRAREMIPESAIIDALLKAADTLRNLINDVENSNEADISERMAALKCISEDPAHPSECMEIAKEPKPITTVINLSLPGDDRLFSVPKEDVENSRKEGKRLYLISLDEIENAALLPMIQDMNQCGTVLISRPELPSTAGGDGAGSGDILSFRILYATVLKPTDLKALLDSDTATIYTVSDDHTVQPAEMASAEPEDMSPAAEPIASPAPVTATPTPAHDPSPPDPEPPTPAAEKAVPEPATKEAAPSVAPKPQANKPGTPPDSAPKEPPVETSPVQSSLRVNINLLDLLMTLAGELVLSRNQLLQAIIRHDRRALEISGQRIDLITSELQEAIMHTRMQPIQNIFNKFPRVVRDLALSLNKRIELTMEGKEVELDKSIIENLNDPMTHLIRNAADHGIESPQDRIEAGKDPVGRIHLKAYHEAGQVNIEIRDIDGERIAASAVAKGLISEERVAAMSPEDKVNLIFLPGFSMSEEVTDLSGRGVGMDVVKTNLDGMGGLVDIDSEPGKGVTIHIKLPLTLAIIPSLLVSDGDERYAIPQVSVVELLRVPPSRIKQRIERVGDARIIRLRDELLPLIPLSDILGTSRDRGDAVTCTDEAAGAATRGMNIVVVHTGIFKYGLIVDRLHDSEEIVVKPLGRHLKGCQGYAGATILGDGRVALILDVTDLARMAELATLSGSVREAESAETGKPFEEEAQTLLLFRNAASTRFAVPLELVERIDKIRSDDIEIAGGRRVIRRGNTAMPVFDIGDVAPVDKFEAGGKALVIVFFVAGMDVGILAVPPIDTVKTVFRMDETALKQPGIAGSAVIQGKTTLMVDVIGIIEALHPEWFTVDRPTVPRSETSKTVILAEDSRFFRNQMKCAIEEAGYNVLEAADGRIAWDLLEKNADLVSLVVTDLEMPNLDGFGFTRKIKDDDRFSHLPVVAVSSLAGKEDIKKAKESGVDNYQVKLDRKKLVECLNQYLETA